MNTQQAQYSALAAQVMAWCDELAAITAEPGKISRFYLTPEHQRCNQLVAGWMQNAGMKTWVDAAGNLCGRYEGSEPNAKTLLIASHLDSIPNAGAYDGILGVMVGIAAVGQLAANHINLPFAIEVIGFGDEEGTRFGSTLLGSRALAGTWNDSWWSLCDRSERTSGGRGGSPCCGDRHSPPRRARCQSAARHRRRGADHSVLFAQ